MALTHDERATRRVQIAKYAKRHTVAETVANFGVSESLVLSACRENGVAPVASARVLRTARSDGSRLRLIADLLYTSKPYAALASKRGVSRQAVSKFADKCLAAGLKVLPRAGGAS